MNKKEALRQLSANLQKYLDNGFQFLTRFLNEFRELLNSASGHEKEIFALLVKQLNFIKALGKEVNQADGNEIIKYQERDYYSIHLQGKNFNFRLLMTFDEKENPVFLAAFYERSGKRATDYTKWKSILEQRYKEYLERE